MFLGAVGYFAAVIQRSTWYVDSSRRYGVVARRILHPAAAHGLTKALSS